MSPEGDLLFPHHSDIFFADLHNEEELDFEKSFFATDVDQSSAINGDSFDSLSGADLIAPLEEEDESAIFIKPLGSPGASADFSNVEELQPHVPASNVPETYTQSLGLEHTNEDYVPTYSHFQKPSLSLGQMKNMYPSNGGLPDLYLQGNRVAGLMSPTSPSGAQPSLLSPGSTVDKLNHLSLGQQAYGGHVFDTKPAVARGYTGSPPGVVPLSPANKRFSPTNLTSPRTGTSNLAYGSNAGDNMSSSNSVVISPPSPVAVPSSVRNPSASSAASTFDSKDSVNLLLNENLQKTQKVKPLYMSSAGLGSRMNGTGGDSPGYLQEVDSTGDGLRPLQAMSSRPPSLMQRSLSSHALGQLRSLAPVPPGSGQMSPLDPSSRMRELGSPGSRAPPHVSDMQGPMMTSMRRVYSTGDIQSMQSGLDRSCGDEGAFRIGRYTLDERKMRIQRYRQKRTERNFNKKIKYACRKTLADSRPRVRGRFAKNDEVELPVKQNGGKHEEDEDEGDLMLEEDDDLFIDGDSSGDISVVMGLNSIDLKHHDDPLSMFASGMH